jgi:L-ascorbate metabolism protein UlaG (beta-lactamase superfamily)
VIEIDGLRVAHLGDLGHKLTDEQLEEIGAIDIVLVPVGGTYTIDSKTAKEVVGQVDPWVVIPMHYHLPDFGLKELAPVEDFLREMGKTEVVPVPKYMISADRLPEDMQLVVLEKK